MVKDKEYIVEHIVELIHDFSGKFLDIKGTIADKVRSKKVFTDWQVSANSVMFFNAKDINKRDEAVVASNLIRYITYDPSSKDYFENKSKKFFDLIKEIKEYNIPETTRFGVRTKCYIPLDYNFKEIYFKILDKFYNKVALNIFGSSPEDLMYVVDVKDNGFTFRISFGPVKSNEVIKYMSFKNDKFSSNGIYVDIDCYIEGSLGDRKINSLISSSVKLSLEKVDNILSFLEL